MNDTLLRGNPITMLKTFILFILLSFVLNLFAQNYIPYFNLCNQADKNYLFEKYDSALFYYEKASTMVPYMHAAYCKKASISAAQTENFELTFTYAAKALSRGANEDFLYSDAFIACRSVSAFNALMEQLPDYKDLKKQSLNLVYGRILDSLFYINQVVIHKYPYYEGPTINVPEWLIYEDTAILNASLYNKLLLIIDQYGYPAEQQLSNEQVFHTYVLLLQYLKRKNDVKLLRSYEKHLYTGQLLPKHFAHFYDAVYSNHGKCPLMWACGEPEDAHLYEIVKADSIRLIYGIKPVESTCKNESGYGSKW